MRAGMTIRVFLRSLRVGILWLGDKLSRRDRLGRDGLSACKGEASLYTSDRSRHLDLRAIGWPPRELRMDEFEFTKIAGAVLVGTAVDFRDEDRDRDDRRTYTRKAGVPLPAADGRDRQSRRRSAGEAGAPAAATPEAAGKEVIALLPKANAGKRQGHLQEMSRVPRLRERQDADRRSEPLGRRQSPEGDLSGIHLFRSDEGQGRRLVVRRARQFLHSPKTYIPGTKMVFTGLPTPQRRGRRDCLSGDPCRYACSAA